MRRNSDGPASAGRGLVLVAALAVASVFGVWVGRSMAPREPSAWADPAAAVPGVDASPPVDLNGDASLDVTDAVYLLQYLFQGGPPPIRCGTEAVTTLFVTRHAERSSGADADLTDVGRQRAEQLARILGTAQIDVMIASNLRRTINTLLPLAAAKGLGESDLVKLDEIGEVVDYVRALPAGTTAVLCHHSFTLHQILDGLCVEGHADIRLSGDSHENLLVVELPAHAAPELVHLEYAELPPLSPPPAAALAAPAER